MSLQIWNSIIIVVFHPKERDDVRSFFVRLQGVAHYGMVSGGGGSLIVGVPKMGENMTQIEIGQHTLGFWGYVSICPQ